MDIQKNSTAPLKSESPIRVKRDFVGRAHFRTLNAAPASAARFQSYQTKLLNGSLIFNTPSSRFAASLIAFDGISTMRDLTESLQNADNLYLWHENIYLEFKGVDGRIDRRLLSYFTKRAWCTPFHLPLNVSDTIEKLEDALKCLYSSEAPSAIDQLFADAQAYLLIHLLGPLFAHCTNMIPLAAIPRSALARQESKKSLATFNDDQKNHVGFAHALDGYFFPSGRDQNSILVDQIVVTCRCKNSVSDDLDKFRMLKECLALSTRSAEAGQTSCLILAWVIDLIESGTLTKTNISPATIHKYVSSIASKLFQNFKNIDVEEIDSDEFSHLYSEIIFSSSPGSQQTAAAALSSWHNFLRTWFAVSPIVKTLYDGIEQSSPRANVLWQHEVDLITSSIDMASGDERLLNQISVSHAIASNIRIRISELLKLRVQNIRIGDSGVEIEISPLRRDGKLKSSSSRRVILIEQGNAANKISDWVTKRKFEGALSQDLLFGDPYKPNSGYKLGQLVITLNQLLKSATGDTTVSFHTYSHTWISNEIRSAMLSSSTVDINPLDLIAADAGHASSQTTLVNYFHHFEEPLRHFLDDAIKRIHFTGAIVSQNSDLSADAFRQRCFRNKQNLSKQQFGWQAIQNHQYSVLAPTAYANFSLRSLDFLPVTLSSKSLKFQDVLHMLSDLTDGNSTAVVSCKCDHSEGVVLAVASFACSLLEQLGLLEKSVHQRTPVSAVGDFQIIFSRSNSTAIKFDRVKQKKLSSLYAWLSGSLEPNIIEAGTMSWSSCFRNGYISMEKPNKAVGLITFLYHALIPINHIYICTSFSLSNSDPKVRLLHSQMISAFRSSYPSPPFFDTKTPRRGRAKSYLVLSSTEPELGDSLESAAVSMGGFNALLFAAYIFRQLQLNIGDIANA
ncbi:MAG: site-specific integrase [Gallionellaceae bacterium]|jgi:integrase